MKGIVSDEFHSTLDRKDLIQKAAANFLQEENVMAPLKRTDDRYRKAAFSEERKEAFLRGVMSRLELVSEFAVIRGAKKPVWLHQAVQDYEEGK